ncbi:MAG: PEP-CTERM sorting domain-containing protein [Nitrospirae bacterium]|nr:MAG: PEP-CTERM sorting domain-containing protein [Nitrospirota bacterium]
MLGIKILLAAMLLFVSACREDKPATPNAGPLAIPHHDELTIGDAFQTLTPVPEPSTLSLMMAGAAFLVGRGVYLRSRRRNS